MGTVRGRGKTKFFWCILHSHSVRRTHRLLLLLLLPPASRTRWDIFWCWAVFVPFQSLGKVWVWFTKIPLQYWRPSSNWGKRGPLGSSRLDLRFESNTITIFISTYAEQIMTW